MDTLLVTFDESGNLYKLNWDYYQELPRKEIPKNYKIIHNNILRKAKPEAKSIIVKYDLHKKTEPLDSKQLCFFFLNATSRNIILIQINVLFAILVPMFTK